MTREDVKKIFPDATDDQIREFLNSNNSEIAKEKAKNEKLKSDFKELQGLKDQNDLLQQKIEEMEVEGMSENEKLKKEIDDFKQKVAQLEKDKFISDQRNEAVKNFKISAEQANEVVKDDGSFDMTKLGEIIAEKESAAALAKEKEIANASGNPAIGGNAGGKNNLAEQLAKGAAKRASSVNEDIINYYKKN